MASRLFGSQLVPFLFLSDFQGSVWKILPEQGEENWELEWEVILEAVEEEEMGKFNSRWKHNKLILPREE